MPFLPRWQPDSQEKMTETLSYLDDQREKVLPILEHLKATVADVKQSRTLMAEFIAGDEFRQQIEADVASDQPTCLFSS